MIRLEQGIGVVQLASDPTTTTITDLNMTVPGPGTPLPLLALLTLTTINSGILADKFLRHETDTTTLPSLLGAVQTAMSKVGKPSLCTAVIYLSKIKPKMPDNVMQPTIYIDAENYDGAGVIDDHEEVQATSSNCHDIILVSLSLSRIESFLEDHKLDLKGSPPGKYAFVLLAPVKMEEGLPTTTEDIRQSLIKPRGFVARLNHLLVMSQNPDLSVFGAFVRVYPAPGVTNITLKDRWIKNQGFQFGGHGLFQEKVPNILNGRKLDIVIARKYFKPVSYKTGRIRPEGFEEYAGYEVKQTIFVIQCKISMESVPAGVDRCFGKQSEFHLYSIWSFWWGMGGQHLWEWKLLRSVERGGIRIGWHGSQQFLNEATPQIGRFFVSPSNWLHLLPGTKTDESNAGLGIPGWSIWASGLVSDSLVSDSGSFDQRCLCWTWILWLSIEGCQLRAGLLFRSFYVSSINPNVRISQLDI